MLLAELIHPVINVFARAGGGGSGSHGGGGGGLGLIAAIGYLPTHFVSRWCVQHSTKLITAIAGSLVAVVVTVPMFYLGPSFGILVGIGAIVGIRSGMKDWLGRMTSQFSSAKQSVVLAASKDSAWNSDAIRNRAHEVFLAYQQDWTEGNILHMRSYMTERYIQHAQLMVIALEQLGRRNVVKSPVVLAAHPIDVVDSINNENDMFGMYIVATANDYLQDIKSGDILYTDPGQFKEIWRFVRSGDNWNLDGIEQVTADAQLRDVALERFAVSEGMFYSLDWGWLLLPQRGQLFSRASFKYSDVNNHVIGNWNGHVVQLYTYIPAKGNAQNYLVGQIALPKSYGGIVIRRREGVWQRGMHGYQRISMEWPDFNKRYSVFATDVDKVTSFELLNPKFMADLYDKELPFNIEVVDNVVYLYAQTKQMQVSGSIERYTAILNVLQAAYKELYM